MKVKQPLYHGTSAAQAIRIVGINGFRSPVHLTESKEAAIHYAKAATAYCEKLAQDSHIRLIKDGYAIFTFHSVPDISNLVVDDYNLDHEKGQWKYLKHIRGLSHYKVEYFPFNETDEQKLFLQCFAIGMWR